MTNVDISGHLNPLHRGGIFLHNLILAKPRLIKYVEEKPRTWRSRPIPQFLVVWKRNRNSQYYLNLEPMCIWHHLPIPSSQPPAVIRPQPSYLREKPLIEAIAFIRVKLVLEPTETLTNDTHNEDSDFCFTQVISNLLQCFFFVFSSHYWKIFVWKILRLTKILPNTMKEVSG